MNRSATVAGNDQVALPWWPSPGAGALALDKIAAVTMNLIDEGGESNLSMRPLAERLDTAPMTLYGYVANRAELLAVVRDAAFGPVLNNLEDGGGWQETLRFLATSLREEVIVAHPLLRPIVASSTHTPGPDVLRMIDHVLASLLADGFATDDAIWAFQVVANLALTFVSRVHTPGLEAFFDQQVPGFPALAEVMRDFAEHPQPVDPFSKSLEALISGIDTTVSRSPV